MNETYPFASNSHWKVINIDNREFGILAKNESNTWKICLTNLIEMWCEELNTETILERCKVIVYFILLIHRSKQQTIINSLLISGFKSITKIKSIQC